MEGLKPEIKKWLKDEDENIAAIELKKISGNSATFSLSAEFDFVVTLEGAGKFKVATRDELLKGGWLKEVKEYCSQGKKAISDILAKATDAFNNLLEEEGDEEEEEEEEIQIEGVGAEDSMFQPVQPNQSTSSSYDPELEKAKEKFDLNNANQAAVTRLMSDYMAVCKSDTKQLGYIAEPLGDNLFKWHVKMFGFNKKDKEEKQLAEDLEKYNNKAKQDHILFEMTFPSTYPFAPPFIRVLTPRFVFHTGHVTIGGSICMELLTKSGWSPSNSIESILIQIRSQLIEGKARIDFGNMSPYSESEAKEAFHRVSQRYGWEK